GDPHPFVTVARRKIGCTKERTRRKTGCAKERKGRAQQRPIRRERRLRLCQASGSGGHRGRARQRPRADRLRAIPLWRLTDRPWFRPIWVRWSKTNPNVVPFEVLGVADGRYCCCAVCGRGGPDMVTIKHHGRVIGRATLASKTHRLLLLAAPTDFRCVRFVARRAPSCKFCTALTLMSGICKCAR